jgi:hypothetical protein
MAAATGLLLELFPNEKPKPKNNAQIPTRPKNKTSMRPVPRVISVSCEAAIRRGSPVSLARFLSSQ